MIPILYGRNERSFLSNGIGRLSDIISCLVTEERNGMFEVEFQYPITGVHYAELNDGMIISVTHDENGDRQPFRIYRKSAPINGIVTFNARHLCYDLRNVIVAPFEATSCSGALAGIASNAMTGCEFTFWTDKSGTKNFKLESPRSAWEMLGGSEGSILDVYGTGEYKLDGTTVRLYLHRGANNGVTIRYAKNLTDLTNEIDSGEVYNAIVPFWHSEETGVTVYGSVTVGSSVPLTLDYWTNENNLRITNEDGTPFEFAYFNLACVVRDFSESFEEQPTVDQLNAAALTFLNNNQPWIPKQNLQVDFVPLWQTDEYAAVAPLQKVKLCDTVTIVYNELGVNATAKVIRVVYNALTDRYDSIELGDARSSFADVITGEFDGQIEKLSEDFSAQMNAAINHATELITGGLGGNVIIKQDANGKPTEILIADNEDPDQAVHVLRINVNGIGFSSNGVQGPYSTAWTLDGAFVADFITTGNLNANLITTGTLNGQNINVINLTASGVNLNGKMKTVEHDTSPDIGETDNYLFFDGGKLTMHRYNDDTLFSLETDWYATAGNPLWRPGGSRLSMFITGGDPDYPQVEIFSNPVGGGSFNLRDAYGSTTASINNSGASFGNVYVDGDLDVSGSKNRVIKTQSFGVRALGAYETAEPYFGDIGESIIGPDGSVFVPIEAIFGETIQRTGYQVFLQAYGLGECYVTERTEDGFTVEGTPGLSFGWELKAKQIDAKERLKEVVR